MRGDVVLVRGLRGEALRRKVWGVQPGRVMVLNPDFYESAFAEPRRSQVHRIPSRGRL